MKSIITMLLCIIVYTANSQTTNPFPKTIDVTGSAEMEIVPDEIFVQVTLKEYERRGFGRINMESIKTEFLNQCRGAGLPDSLISIATYRGNGNYWWKKKKNRDDLFTTITYQLKFSNTKQIDNLVERLDDDATQYFGVVKVSHSKILEFRKQLKIQAVKAAKEKAFYLADAINEQVGAAVSISEPEEVDNARSNAWANNAMLSQVRLRDGSAMEIDDEDAESGNGIDFKKIKLRFEVKAVFALK